MPGWIWQTIVYAPFVLNFFKTVPLVRTPAIVLFFVMPGPLVITMLCGSDPVHWNLTVSPELMLSDFGPNVRCGPTLTVFVAASAGTAIAAATAATATRVAMRRFIAGVKPPDSVGRSGTSPAWTSGDAPSFPIKVRSVRRATFGPVRQKTGVSR